MEDLTVTGARDSGRAAYAMARLEPHDIDMTSLYDAFTITPVLFLEDLDFCEKGDGGPFVMGGTIAPGGRLPINTNGGGLSYCHPGMYGLLAMIEGVRQIRGDCGPRNVPDCEVTLAHGNGVALSSQCTSARPQRSELRSLDPGACTRAPPRSLRLDDHRQELPRKIRLDLHDSCGIVALVRGRREGRRERKPGFETVERLERRNELLAGEVWARSLETLKEGQRSTIPEHVAEVGTILLHEIGVTLLETLTKRFHFWIAGFGQRCDRNNILRTGCCLADDLGIFPTRGRVRSDDLRGKA